MVKLDSQQKKNNQIKISFLLFLITILGFFLRSLGYFNIILAGDFEYHWGVAKEIVEQKAVYMLGPKASVDENLFLGPFYYYFLSFIYFISNGDYKIAIIIFSLISSISIPLLYKVSRKWFDEKQSLVLSLIYSTSAYLIEIGNFPWNPYLLPILILMTIIILEKTKQNYLYIMSLGIMIGILLQSHASTVFISVYFFYKSMSSDSERILKKIFLFILGFLLIMLPWFIIDINSNFDQSKRAFNIIANRSNENCDFIYWVQNHGHGERCFHYFRNSIFILKQFSAEILNTQKIIFAFSMFLLILNFFINKKFKNEVLWFLIPWFGYLIYSSNVYHHYFLQFFPLPIFVIGQFIFDLQENNNTKVKYISYVILFGLILYNLFSFINNLQNIRG